MLDPVELEEMSEIWGTQFADCLITDRRWSTCNQPAAILAAGFVVERAIRAVVPGHFRSERYHVMAAASDHQRLAFGSSCRW